MSVSGILKRLRSAALGLTGLLGVAIIGVAAVHLVWASVEGESPALGEALDSLSAWVDDPARSGALALLGVGFILVAVLLVVAVFVRTGQGRLRIAKHGRATTDVDRESLANALERALRDGLHKEARVSISRRHRVNVSIPGSPGEAVGDTASAAHDLASDWCASHGVPCGIGRVTVEKHDPAARVDPPPRKRKRELK